MQNATTVLVNLEKYRLQQREPTYETSGCKVRTDTNWHTCCGPTLYKFDWDRNDGTINEYLFSSDSSYDEVAGNYPLKYNLMSWKNNDIGDYTY